MNDKTGPRRGLALAGAAIGLVLAALYLGVMHTAAGQDFLVSRAAAAAVAPADTGREDAIRVFVCGSAAPLPTVGRAQACLAVVTPSHYFVVDAGAGSANNLALANLPGARLDGILLTHFHSDHIAAIPDINLGSWAGGRPHALNVYGPPGVGRVVSGLNEAYALDHQYRTAHHGAAFMPMEYGLLNAVEQPVDAIMTFGDLTITAFPVDHGPVEPAVGYRFDYKGRSVVITGDTIVTDGLRSMVSGADLLFSDALSIPIVTAMQTAATPGRPRGAKILADIQDYHASVSDVVELTRSSGVGMTALYHLVPGPRNALMENIFRRDFTDNMVLTRDLMWFELPVGGKEIRIDPS